jgi:KEOPS complex subunit Pcc1
MDHEAVLTFEYPDGQRARSVERSVRVEAGDIEGDRTEATVDRDGATLTVTIAAADLTALRAGLNTWSSLVGVAERCAGATA